MASAYIKAIYFDEYARMFGAKPLDVPTNYIPYESIQDKNSTESSAFYLQQLTRDLQYLIESHAYLPFTRQGKITLIGDRRFKKGTFVRYKATGEIFYIDAVTNNVSVNDKSISRTTTLNVSRGMVEKFIDGIPIKTFSGDTTLSYFNICNTETPKGAFDPQNLNIEKFSKTVLSQWKVRFPIFNFFLNKMQFGTDEEIEDYILTNSLSKI